jgi:hypothetical protein
MKQVIDITTLSVIQVPVEYIECSVCGEFHSPESYRKLDESTQSRTNCEKCYSMPLEEFYTLSASTKVMQKSQQYRAIVEKLTFDRNLLGGSVSVEEMIDALNKLPKGSRVLVTQSGYYCEDPIANCFLPTHYKTVGETNIYKIGSSDQAY